MPIKSSTGKCCKPALIALLLSGLLSIVPGCFDDVQVETEGGHRRDTPALEPPSQPAASEESLAQSFGTMTDPRDQEIYVTVTVGSQTWMAENLRFQCLGSMLNLENPSKEYGRLYKLVAAQTACPQGWHLPSDSDWDLLEMAHGMPKSFVGEVGWRGEHAFHLKSRTGWNADENGNDSLGFNVLPAGYYFSGDLGGEVGMQGLGISAAFWSSVENEVATARFIFGARDFVNKWKDENNDSGSGLSCRCVED